MTAIRAYFDRRIAVLNRCVPEILAIRIAEDHPHGR